MSYLKDLMKDGRNISLEFFMHPDSVNNKKVVLNPSNKDNYADYERKGIDLTEKGIIKTSCYYNLKRLENKIKSLNKSINKNHKGYDFLTRIQNIDFVPADFPNYKRNFNYNIFINGDRVEYLDTIDISKISLLTTENDILNPISICIARAGRKGNLYAIYCDSIGNLFCLDEYGVRCNIKSNSANIKSMNISDFINAIGKSEGNGNFKDYYVVNKSLVAKLKEGEDY